MKAVESEVCPEGLIWLKYLNNWIVLSIVTSNVQSCAPHLLPENKSFGFFLVFWPSQYS